MDWTNHVRFLSRFHPRPSPLPYNPPIALAGASVRTGGRGRAAVPGWSRYGGAAWWGGPTPNPGPGDGLAGKAEGLGPAQGCGEEPRGRTRPTPSAAKTPAGRGIRATFQLERRGCRAPLPTLGKESGINGQTGNGAWQHPPFALPGISPSRGEIGSFGAPVALKRWKLAKSDVTADLPPLRGRWLASQRGVRPARDYRRGVARPILPFRRRPPPAGHPAPRRRASAVRRGAAREPINAPPVRPSHCAIPSPRSACDACR